MAMGIFEGHMSKMAEGFAAVRTAELELAGKYDIKVVAMEIFLEPLLFPYVLILQVRETQYLVVLKLNLYLYYILLILLTTTVQFKTVFVSQDTTAPSFKV